MKNRITKLLVPVSVLAMALTGCGNDVSQRAVDDGSSNAVQANATAYSITAEVNTAYSAQKLGELAALGDGYTFEFDGSDNDVRFGKLGSSTVSVKATHGSETTAITLNVTVVDTTSPVFNGIKDITAQVGEQVDLKAGVTVTDNYDQNVDFTVTYDKDDADHNAAGKHTITYVAKDSSGNPHDRGRRVADDYHSNNDLVRACQHRGDHQACRPERHVG